jgi:hypothetical protein
MSKPDFVISIKKSIQKPNYEQTSVLILVNKQVGGTAGAML